MNKRMNAAAIVEIWARPDRMVERLRPVI